MAAFKRSKDMPLKFGEIPKNHYMVHTIIIIIIIIIHIYIALSSEIIQSAVLHYI